MWATLGSAHHNFFMIYIEYICVNKFSVVLDVCYIKFVS